MVPTGGWETSLLQVVALVKWGFCQQQIKWSAIFAQLYLTQLKNVTLASYLVASLNRLVSAKADRGIKILVPRAKVTCGAWWIYHCHCGDIHIREQRYL